MLVLKKKMLAKYKNKIDIDGYAMLLLSTLVIVASAGISYLFCFKKIFDIAKNTNHNCTKSEKCESIIICVLGKKLINDQPDNEYSSRLNRAVYILSRNDASEVLLLGGKTGKAKISEAAAGQVFLLKNNIASSRVYLEEESRNTLENIINAIDLLSAEDKSVVVISNRYHLARAKQMAEGLGLEVELCAAEDKLNINLLMFLKLMLEALHVHWYIVGRSYAHITKNTRIIKRVG